MQKISTSGRCRAVFFLICTYDMQGAFFPWGSIQKYDYHDCLQFKIQLACLAVPTRILHCEFKSRSLVGPSVTCGPWQVSPSLTAAVSQSSSFSHGESISANDARGKRLAKSDFSSATVNLERPDCLNRSLPANRKHASGCVPFMARSPFGMWSAFRKLNEISPQERFPLKSWPLRLYKNWDMTSPCLVQPIFWMNLCSLQSEDRQFILSHRGCVCFFSCFDIDAKPRWRTRQPGRPLKAIEEGSRNRWRSQTPAQGPVRRNSARQCGMPTLWWLISWPNRGYSVAHKHTVLFHFNGSN